jgi:AbrB family looped-hinge helix DNA binding protein
MALTTDPARCAPVTELIVCRSPATPGVLSRAPKNRARDLTGLRLDLQSKDPHALSMKSRISAKGQITVPISIREKLGLTPGTAVRFELCEEGALMRKGREDTHSVDQVFGRLNLRKPVDTLLDEMRGPRPPARRRTTRRASRQ